MYIHAELHGWHKTIKMAMRKTYTRIETASGD